MRLRDQAAIEHGAGRPGQTDIAGLDGGNGEGRGMDEVAQFVGEEAQPLIQRLDAFFRIDEVALGGKLRHGVGDTVVQAAVEGAKLVHRDRRVLLEREVGDRLAEIAVVVDHLIDGEALLEELAPVQRRRAAELGAVRRQAACPAGNLAASHRLGALLQAQRLDELVEEHRYSVLQLRSGRFRHRPLSDLQPAPVDEVAAVLGQEFVQHLHTLR
jgi:hypothetical protein